MGMKLSKELIERATGPKVPIKGTLDMFLAGDPPKTTHHDKDIRRDGNGTPVLVDSDRLKAARLWYEQRMASNRQNTVLAAPLQASLTFVWFDPALHPDANRFARRVWLAEKPDWDNAAKGCVDALVKAG